MPIDEHNSDYEYVTQKNSRFSKDLLNYAAREKSSTRRLCAIGLALHVVADTWSHRGFSGRVYQQENCVDQVEVVNSEKDSVFCQFLPLHSSSCLYCCFVF